MKGGGRQEVKWHWMWAGRCGCLSHTFPNLLLIQSPRKDYAEATLGKIAVELGRLQKVGGSLMMLGGSLTWICCDWGRPCVEPELFVEATSHGTTSCSPFPSLQTTGVPSLAIIGLLKGSVDQAVQSRTNTTSSTSPDSVSWKNAVGSVHTWCNHFHMWLSEYARPKEEAECTLRIRRELVLWLQNSTFNPDSLPRWLKVEVCPLQATESLMESRRARTRLADWWQKHRGQWEGVGGKVAWCRALSCSMNSVDGLGNAPVIWRQEYWSSSQSCYRDYYGVMPLSTQKVPYQQSLSSSS